MTLAGSSSIMTMHELSISFAAIIYAASPLRFVAGSSARDSSAQESYSLDCLVSSAKTSWISRSFSGTRLFNIRLNSFSS